MKETLKKLYDDASEIRSFVQAPFAWLRRNDLCELAEQWKDLSKHAIKFEIHKMVLGQPSCLVCNVPVTRIDPRNFGYGFRKTCGLECENKFKSIRQTGENNTSHRMTDETKAAMSEKISKALKKRIREGTYTPKSENYLRSSVKTFKMNGNTHIVRSLWEFIFWIHNPHLEYEKVRLEYFDTKRNKNRIYIVDFSDPFTNELYEVKPKKYQYTLQDKLKDHDVTIIDEGYFRSVDLQFVLKMIDDCGYSEDPDSAKRAATCLLKRYGKSAS